jgi:hypothetical protein
MKAYELLSGPEKWTKGVNARDHLDRPLPSHTDQQACKWCMLGAVAVCYGPDWPGPKDRIMARLRMHPVNWNDAPERTYEEVVGLLRELDI